MRRTKEEAQKTKEEIYRAGLAVFAENGFAAATMQDVAKRAGVTRGAIYWHYRTKQAFYEETVSRLTSAYEEIILQVRQADSVLDGITAAIQRLVHRFLNDSEFRAMQELTMRESDHRSDAARRNQESFERASDDAVEIVRAGIERGEICSEFSPAVVSLTVQAFIGGLFLTMTEDGVTVSDEEIAEAAMIFRRALEPRTIRRRKNDA